MSNRVDHQKTQPNDSRATVRLSFWFSTWPSVNATAARVIKCFFLVNRVENQNLNQKPKPQPNDSRAAVWLSFWFSTRPSADTISD